MSDPGHEVTYIVFASDIQPITVKKIITFITESCFPEAYRHHKCPMGGAAWYHVSSVIEFAELADMPSLIIIIIIITMSARLNLHAWGHIFCAFQGPLSKIRPFLCHAKNSRRALEGRSTRLLDERSMVARSSSARPLVRWT